MESLNRSVDDLVGRVAALEWMVAQLYAVVVGQYADPKAFFDETRETLKERQKQWGLPPHISQAAVDTFERILSIGEANAVRAHAEAEARPLQVSVIVNNEPPGTAQPSGPSRSDAE